jgi:hypothetical protein
MEPIVNGKTLIFEWLGWWSGTFGTLGLDGPERLMNAVRVW